VAETRLKQILRRRALPLSLILLPAQPLQAAPVAVDIPGLPLLDALERLSSVYGVSVGSNGGLDPSVRTRRVHGRMDAQAALHHMLGGTGLREQALGLGSFRLVPAPQAAPLPGIARSAEVAGDIVVTAAKRRLPLSALAGEAERLSFDTPLGAIDQRGSASDLVLRVPTLSSTHLGAGRNKLFLRGIADSSFSGRSQGTLGEYLGEARLNSDAPDPGLRLYDMKSVEILKGPQGTLYGGGTLAGVLRFEPERPDLGRVSASTDLAATATQSGAPGYALAATLNLPISEDMLGSRWLAYRTVDGGYIRDAGRGRDDVNGTTTTGFRGQVRAKPQGWTVDLLATHQRIASRDGDYAERGLPPYTRSTALAQPSRNIFTLLDVEARRHAGGIDITSTTSLTWNRLDATYDATVLADHAAAFQDDRIVRALSHETRLSHSDADGGGWLLGAAAFAEREQERHDATGIGDPRFTNRLASHRLEAAAFGNYTRPLGKLLLTAGARLNFSRFGARTDPSPYLVSPTSLDKSSFRILPMATLTWRATPRLTFSLGYRQSYRASTVALEYVDHVIPVIYGNYLETAHPDTIHVVNLSVVRRGGGNRLPFTLETTLSGFIWNWIQTDLIDSKGFVYTTNSGAADLLNLDTSISLRPFSSLNLRAGLSLNKEHFRRYTPDYVGSLVGEFASIPPVSAYADAAWSKAIASDWTLQLEGRLSYIGQSALGPQDLHALTQGEILASTAVASLKRKGYSVSLSVDNLAGREGNMFAYGNPFTLRQGRQITPQRPGSVTLAFRAGF
jgi:iron complex outermembrane recepter protein